MSRIHRYPESLETFLLKYRVKRKFENNRKAHNNGDPFLGTIRPRHYFGGAFSWKDSPEGHGFWWRLEDKYLKETGLL